MNLDLHQILGTPWMLWTGVAGVLTAAAILASLRDLIVRIDARLFVTHARKLLARSEHVRAVKLCDAAPRARLARLTLFMLGQEIPARGPAPGHEARGYREAGPTLDFAELLRARLERELATLRREVHLRYGLGIVLAAAALIAGGVALTLYLTTTTAAALSELNVAPFVVTVVPALGSWNQLRGWRRELAALELTVSELLPLIVPLEEMTSEQREAAERARATYPGAGR